MKLVIELLLAALVLVCLIGGAMICWSDWRRRPHYDRPLPDDQLGT